MNQMKKWIFSSLLLTLVASGAAFARDEDKQIDVARPFDAQRSTIIDELRGDKYSEISPENRSKVVEALNRISSRLEESGADVARMPQATQIDIYNDQSMINNILTQAAADSRMICRREKTVGSNMPQNNCLTVAERRRMRDQAQDDTLRMQRTPRKVE